MEIPNHSTKGSRVIYFVKESDDLTIPQLIENKAFDELFLWDTNIENHPRLVLSQVNGKLEVKNPILYENFKKKAK